MASPLTRPWRKTCSTPLQSRPSNCQGLFKLPAPLTILASERCSLLRPHSGFFLVSSTCVKATWNIPDTFPIWRERKQLTVGECRGKRIGCKLGTLQKAFREHAFLQQGGDALTEQKFGFKHTHNCEILPCFSRISDNRWCLSGSVRK